MSLIKIIRFLVGLGWIVLVSCHSNEQDGAGFQISGLIKGQDEGYAFLQKPSPDGLITIDSVKISDGRYSFSGKVEMPQLHYIKINNSKYYITFFLENSRIDIQSHIDSLFHSNITGSECQKELDMFHAEINPYKEQLKELYKQYYRAERENDTARMNAIDLEYEQIHGQQLKRMQDYAYSNPSSVVASYITARYLANELDYAHLDSLYRRFSRTLENDKYLEKLESRLEILEKVAIGKPAVNIMQNDTAHQQVSLASLKGKYVLLEFWASWCSSCNKENEILKNIYNEYHSRGFEIFAVSLDNDHTQWTDAVKNSELPWVNVSDLKGWQSEVRKSYGVVKTPHTLLIDREGKIIAKDLFGQELQDELDKHLAVNF